MKLSKGELKRIAGMRFMAPYSTRIMWTIGAILAWAIICAYAESTLWYLDFPFGWLGSALLIAFAIFCFIMAAREDKYVKTFLEENKNLIDKEL